jgi:hypothetical protein
VRVNELGGTMTEGTHELEQSNPGVVTKFLTGRLSMEARDMRIWSVSAIIIMSLLLFWAAALAYAYVADDRSAAPADERSVPAPRSY